MEYKLVRSARKTLSVSIADGKVTVKAPLKMSADYIDKFVESKRDWIAKKLGESEKKRALLKDVADGVSVLYHGAFLPVSVSAACKRTVFKADTLFLPDKCTDKTARDKAVAAWGKRTAKTELSERLFAVSKAIGLEYCSFSLTNAKTKWGSCDGHGNIMLNWRLIMLEDILVAYVIVHELCHTVHHDHSAAFWAEVQKHMPEYKTIKKRLKAFSALTAMYR